MEVDLRERVSELWRARPALPEPALTRLRLLLRYGGRKAAAFFEDADALFAEHERLETMFDALKTDIQASSDPDNDPELRCRLAETQHEADRLRPRIEEIRQRAKAVSAESETRTVRVAQGNLMLELVVLVGALFVWPPSAKFAHSTHIEFYAAVAGMAPVLLVAGLVELAVLRPTGGFWMVLAFSIPALCGGGGALHVLATHESTQTTLTLASWGLSAMSYALIAYFVMHLKFGPRHD